MSRDASPVVMGTKLLGGVDQVSLLILGITCTYTFGAICPTHACVVCLTVCIQVNALLMYFVHFLAIVYLQ